MNTPHVFEGLPKQEKQTDTRRWLLESVAPSLARIMVEDHDFFVQFLRKVYVIGGVGEAQQPDDPFDGAADFDPVVRSNPTG